MTGDQDQGPRVVTIDDLRPEWLEYLVATGALHPGWLHRPSEPVFRPESIDG